MTGGELRTYDVTIGNNTTQMRLNDADAEFYREHHTAELADDSAAQAASGGDVEVKRGTAPNKSRVAANKAG